jgi:DNA-binding SARP family transcriptional activator
MAQQISVARMSLLERAWFEKTVAGCHFQLGDLLKADAWYARATRHATRQEQKSIAEMRLVVSACASAARGDRSQAGALLRKALSSNRKKGDSALFGMFPKVASKVAALALDLNIEVEYVRGVIKRQCLSAPDGVTPNWPCPIAVRTFGKTELTLHGEVVAPSGKAQLRPLMLLHALVVAGSAGKSHKILADTLWPDASNPSAALNVTIHRLRRLLGHGDAVLVAGGKLTLNASLVWSDVAALDLLCNRIAGLPDNVPAADLNRVTADLLNLYRGPFCEGKDEGWLLPVRDRWSNRFVNAADRLGLRLEALKLWRAAHDLYLCGLAAEPLAETFHRGLMRCADAQHDPSAALAAYRRCRATLSALLDRPPSEETEKLAERLRLPRDGGA